MESPIVEALEAHPYYPLGVSIPKYVGNTMGAFNVVSTFCLGCGAIFAMTYLLAVRLRPAIHLYTLLLTFWRVLCGSIHLFFEGYFSYNHVDMAAKTDLFGQLWKEYSLSDSRYLTQDPFLVCMESITAFLWGPIAFFIAYATVTDHHWRFPLQLIVSLGQLYGLLLYYGIFWYNEFVNGVDFSRPERYYYWAYYVLCNAFWIFIPFCQIMYCAHTLADAYKKTKIPAKKHE
ncbi:hypothetical protein QQS21_007277 [Conoideocrella luteorostrata]|uniref:EXPERA domain-containing protein n=1 Tax=Conoideocrella luteorostrata TaxID=1105319 RepID=A0AAJ0CNG8_9HYPO|nr:hypothetical protein QQS21_007277 [Conoideocrella luteorostrata]